jgi:hypothetical protein
MWPDEAAVVTPPREGAEETDPTVLWERWRDLGFLKQWWQSPSPRGVRWEDEKGATCDGFFALEEALEGGRDMAWMEQHAHEAFSEALRALGEDIEREEQDIRGELWHRLMTTVVLMPLAPPRSGAQTQQPGALACGRLAHLLRRGSGPHQIRGQ